MAVHKSNLITNETDRELQIPRSEQGVERVAIAQVTFSGAVADNDVVALCRIPVDARITSIRLWSDDLGTTGDFNYGLYKGTTAIADLADTLAVDEDCLATAVDQNAAALADVEIRYEVKDINTANDAAWELAGLSSRPAYGNFIVCATASEATTAAGDVTVIIRYTE